MNEVDIDENSIGLLETDRAVVDLPSTVVQLQSGVDGSFAAATGQSLHLFRWSSVGALVDAGKQSFPADRPVTFFSMNPVGNEVALLHPSQMTIVDGSGDLLKR